MGFLPAPAATEEEARQRRERVLAQQAYEEAYAKSLIGQYGEFQKAARAFRDAVLEAVFDAYVWILLAGVMIALACGIAAAYVWLFR